MVETMSYLATWFVALALGIALGYSRGRIDGAVGFSSHLVAHGHLGERLAAALLRSWERRKP